MSYVSVHRCPINQYYTDLWRIHMRVLQLQTCSCVRYHTDRTRSRGTFSIVLDYHIQFLPFRVTTFLVWMPTRKTPPSLLQARWTYDDISIIKINYCNSLSIKITPYRSWDLCRSMWCLKFSAERLRPVFKSKKPTVSKATWWLTYWWFLNWWPTEVHGIVLVSLV